MAEITIDEVTSGVIEGSGAFDEIMKAAQIRLEHEYDKDRIKGTEYSKVYLGSMESAMQQSIAFVLGRQQASAQADLSNAQIALIEIERANAIKQGELIDSEILLSASKVELSDKQIEKMTQEILVLEQEVLTAQETLKLVAAQVVKMEKDGDLVQQQIYSEAANTQDSIPNETDPANPYDVAGMIHEQKLKIRAETGLLINKGFTEESNYREDVDAAPVEGTVGRQKGVYEAQAAHFTDDTTLRHKKLEYDLETVRIGVSDEPTRDYQYQDKEPIFAYQAKDPQDPDGDGPVPPNQPPEIPEVDTDGGPIKVPSQNGAQASNGPLGPTFDI